MMLRTLKHLAGRHDQKMHGNRGLPTKPGPKIYEDSSGTKTYIAENMSNLPNVKMATIAVAIRGPNKGKVLVSEHVASHSSMIESVYGLAADNDDFVKMRWVNDYGMRGLSADKYLAGAADGDAGIDNIYKALKTLRHYGVPVGTNVSISTDYPLFDGDDEPLEITLKENDEYSEFDPLLYDLETALELQLMGYWDDYVASDRTETSWTEVFLKALAAGIIAAYLLGLGAKKTSDLSEEELQQLREYINAQEQYLIGFGTAAHDISPAMGAARAAMYAAALTLPFWWGRTRYLLLPAYPGDGTSECLCITTPHSRVLTERGLVPISKIKVGDFVFTHKMRWRKVVNTWVTPSDKKQGATVTLANGNVIGCTDDHKFLTRSGWMPIKDIDTEGLLIYAIEYDAMHEMWKRNGESSEKPRMSEMSANLPMRKAERQTCGRMYKLRNESKSQRTMANASECNDNCNHEVESIQTAKVSGHSNREQLGYKAGWSPLYLLLGKREKGLYLSPSVGLGTEVRQSSEWLCDSSQRYGQDKRQSGKFTDNEQARPRSFTYDAQTKKDKLPNLRTRIYSEIKGPEQKSAEVLFTGMLPQGANLYDIEVEEDHSFVIEGMIAHNSRCHCSWDIVPLDEEAGDYDCTWQLGYAEHCPTCAARAQAWNPLQVRGWNYATSQKEVFNATALKHLQGLHNQKMHGNRGSAVVGKRRSNAAQRTDVQQSGGAAQETAQPKSNLIKASDSVHVLGVGEKSSVGSVPGVMTETIHRNVTSALDDINKVHGLPADMTKIPVEASDISGVRAQLYVKRTSDDIYSSADAKSSDVPLAIMVSTGAADAEINPTFTHEFGHYVHNKIIGTEHEKDILQALDNSAAIKNTRADIQHSIDASRYGRDPITGKKINADERLRRGQQAKFNEYTLLSTEQFARAYAQYIAVKSGNKAALAELLSGRQWPAYAKNAQWSEKDFAPIMDAFDKMFSNLGWGQKIATKHLTGQHNQKLHGNRGVALGHAVLATKSEIPYRPSAKSERSAERFIKKEFEREHNPADYDKAMTDMVDEMRRVGSENKMCINAPYDAAWGIINSGRIKTQFETTRSNGFYNPADRADAENKGLGVPNNIDPKKRPVYGYLAGTQAAEMVDYYGEVVFELKDSVKQRSTMTQGDSTINGMGAGRITGSPVLNPNKNSVKASDIKLQNGKYTADPSKTDYFEVQIHGGVGLKDIARVRFTEIAFLKNGKFNPIYLDMVDTLKAAGIEVVFDVAFKHLSGQRNQRMHGNRGASIGRSAKRDIETQPPAMPAQLTRGTTGQSMQRMRERVAIMEKTYPGVKFSTAPSNPLAVKQNQHIPGIGVPRAILDQKAAPITDPALHARLRLAYEQVTKNASGVKTSGATYTTIKYASGLTFQQVFGIINSMRITNPKSISLSVDRSGASVVFGLRNDNGMPL